MNLIRELSIVKRENFKGFQTLKHVEKLRSEIITAILKLNVLVFAFDDSCLKKAVLHINNCLPRQKKFRTKKIMFVHINKTP